jgi:hypothetical protein
MAVNRISIGDLKLVYVICANKKIKYTSGRSPIAYIGTTKKGIERVAQSVAYRADDILSKHGVNSFEVRIITCGVRRRVRTWRKLERALLLVFKERFGGVPYCNTVGKNFIEGDEFRYFSKRRVMNIIDNLGESGIAPEHVISN